MSKSKVRKKEDALLPGQFTAVLTEEFVVATQTEGYDQQKVQLPSYHSCQNNFQARKKSSSCSSFSVKLLAQKIDLFRMLISSKPSPMCAKDTGKWLGSQLSLRRTSRRN